MIVQIPFVEVNAQLSGALPSLLPLLRALLLAAGICKDVFPAEKRVRLPLRTVEKGAEL